MSEKEEVKEKSYKSVVLLPFILCFLFNFGIIYRLRTLEDAHESLKVEVYSSSNVRMKREVIPDSEGQKGARSKGQSSANVEFIHPKLRGEMESQPSDPENPWVWLTSYSRIPVSENNFSFASNIIAH